VNAFDIAKKDLLKRHHGWGSGLDYAVEHAALMDSFLVDLVKSKTSFVSSQGWALVALGGYGRGALAPFSDIDLLFLTPTANNSDISSLVEAVLYPLWDLKIDVGHAVRTIDQCLNLAGDDFATMSTQLDGRLLIGDEILFSEFDARLHHWLGSRTRRQTFFKTLKANIADRHKKYKESPYLLEPNLKEGQGGLRDLHAIRWAGNGLYNLRDIHELQERGFLAPHHVSGLGSARSFIWDVRLYLHQLAGEKTDTLTFELQEDLTRALGYEDDGHKAGVEHFMKAFYTHVYRTKSTLDYFLSRVEQDLVPPRIWRMTQRPRRVEKGLTILRGQIELGATPEIRERPGVMMRAFEISAQSGLPISQRSLELIRSNLDLVDDGFRTDTDISRSFLSGLTAIPPGRVNMPGNPDAMQILHFLEAYLPELAGVRAQVQHDAYHVYTVDVHLVVTLWELKKIALGLTDPGENGFDAAVLERVTNRRVLFLAALLHDIGKGQGAGHAQLGARMVPGIGRRLGLNDSEIEDLVFLVLEHLFLIEIATRRDLTEEKLIVNTARRIGDVDRLHMLYLVTIADSRATGPGVMNPWKKGLLRDLYSKIHRILTKSDLAMRETSRRTDDLLKTVEKTLVSRLPAEEIDQHLAVMSAHYLATMNADQVVRHILMERELGDRPLIWELEHKDDDYVEATIMTKDRPGLLSRMAGAFTLHNINIFGAQIFTRANNVALDIFQVSHPPDRVYEAEAWERLRKDIERILTGRLALDYRLAGKQPLVSSDRAPSRVRKPDRVIVDSETSDFYTIVEVYTYDRLGLLYDLTRAFYDLQLSINIAKISTNADQVVDVFYIRDFYGQKLVDGSQIDELTDALYFTLKR
jgi:[protein-PII] uridylyltransferase